MVTRVYHRASAYQRLGDRRVVVIPSRDVQRRHAQHVHRRMRAARQASVHRGHIATLHRRKERGVHVDKCARRKERAARRAY